MDRLVRARVLLAEAAALGVTIEDLVAESSGASSCPSTAPTVAEYVDTGRASFSKGTAGTLLTDAGVVGGSSREEGREDRLSADDRVATVRACLSLPPCPGEPSSGGRCPGRPLSGSPPARRRRPRGPRPRPRHR